MRRIKAFTIIELTVALLISSIVMAISYYAFLFFSSQYNSYQKKSAELTEYRLFQKAFQHDLETANFITDSAQQSILLMNDPEQIVYKWDSAGIVRMRGEAIDSFRLRNSSLTVRNVNDSLKLTQQIVFRFLFSKTILESRFVKQYSAQQLMQAEKNYQ